MGTGKKGDGELEGFQIMQCVYKITNKQQQNNAESFLDLSNKG